MRHGGDNGYGKDADCKIGGPRYLLAPENRPMRVIPAKAGIHPLPGDVDPRLRGGDEVIFMSSDGPQAHGNSVEGSRQQGEIRPGQFLSPPEQAHDDKEISIGKKRTPEFRHRDRIRHGGDDGHGQDADPSADGRSALLAPSRSHSRESGNPVCRQLISQGLRSGFPLSRE